MADNRERRDQIIKNTQRNMRRKIGSRMNYSKNTM